MRTRKFDHFVNILRAIGLEVSRISSRDWTARACDSSLDRIGDGQVARYYWLLLAEGHLNRRRFGAMLDRIALLPVPTG
jgi:hypothetical protein